MCVIGNTYASSTSRAVTLTRGCKTVTVPPVLLSGHVDQIVGRVGGGILVSGWAFDPQHRGTAQIVRVLLDGRAVANIPTSVLRTTINNAIHLSGRHGFSSTVNATPGRHSIEIVVMASHTTSTSWLLTHRSVTVPA